MLPESLSLFTGCFPLAAFFPHSPIYRTFFLLLFSGSFQVRPHFPTRSKGVFRTAFSPFHSETKVFCQRLKPYRNHKSPYPPDSVITKILLRYPGQTLLYPLCPTSLYIKYFRESLCQPSSCIRCNCVINYNTTVAFVKGFSKRNPFFSGCYRMHSFSF